MGKAYYHNSISDFIDDDNAAILGHLHDGVKDYSRIWTTTTISWENLIDILKRQLSKLIETYKQSKNWTIILEYEIPRLLSRIDIVILTDYAIFVIEYKDGETEFNNTDIRQVEDYAMDLSDFHYESRNRTIIPILLCSEAQSERNKYVENSKNVKRTITTNSNYFVNDLYDSYSFYKSIANTIDYNAWINSKYSPTPTIIQAAQAIYLDHDVREITTSGAEAINLSETTEFILHQLNKTKQLNRKTICFVTGVPGAGKTLVGLDLIHRLEFNEGNDNNSSYFSGNGPLIEVLQYALNESEYLKELHDYKEGLTKGKPRKNDAKRKIKSKIQNLHNFIKDGIKKQDALFEKIVVFDEAQRCWNAKHFFNKTKRNNTRLKEDQILKPVEKSEVEILFEIMSRHDDWAFIVALVGSGQEINTGEAGIEEWERVLKEQYADWDICISNQLIDGTTSIVNHKIFNTGFEERLVADSRLHLSVSQRSFKANNLNEWVNAVLDNKYLDARNIYTVLKDRYPLCVTRSLQKSKDWLKNKKQGNKKIGLIASSGAQRLKPLGLYVKEPINVPYWFFNTDDDIRSSDFLETVCTEFAIQGLEIDWTCVCWDLDLHMKNTNWAYSNFSGTKWKKVNPDNQNEQKYILNTYRVLLTRAREGMIIFVPTGDENDATRPPKEYDKIFNYLKSCGIPEI